MQLSPAKIKGPAYFAHNITRSYRTLILINNFVADQRLLSEMEILEATGLPPARPLDSECCPLLPRLRGTQIRLERDIADV